MYKLIFFMYVLLIIDKSVQENTEYVTYENFKGYAVKGDVVALENFKKSFEESSGIIFVEQIENEVNYLVSNELSATFEKHATDEELELTIVHENFADVLLSEKKKTLRAGGFSWDNYYDVDDINNYLISVHQRYPNSTNLIKGGKSYEGRDILGLRIMTPYDEEAEKPAVFIESGIHAREWITPATSTYFINQLLTSCDPSIVNLRKKYDWHIFPTTNPDGYHYSHVVDRFWRKTRSRSDNNCYGADPNRNWDHNWNTYGSSSNPCNYDTYAGKKAFSEIETKSLSQYIMGVRNLMVYVGLHADAQMLLVPYSDSVEHTDNYNDLIKIGKTSLEYGRKVNGAIYKGPATAAEILYKASGGSMDWVREVLSTPLVFTYELRGKFFCWPRHRIPEQGDELTQMILGLMVEAENLGYF